MGIASVLCPLLRGGHRQGTFQSRSVVAKKGWSGPIGRENAALVRAEASDYKESLKRSKTDRFDPVVPASFGLFARVCNGSPWGLAMCNCFPPRRKKGRPPEDGRPLRPKDARRGSTSSTPSFSFRRKCRRSTDRSTRRLRPWHRTHRVRPTWLRACPSV